MTAYERLREADPLPPVPDAPPPEDVLAAIVATPREPVRRPRRRLVPVIAAGTAVAAGAVALTVLPGGSKPDLAARAYAAMSPTETILHLVEVSRYTSSSPRKPYWRGADEPPRQVWCCGRSETRSRSESWQRGKEAHRISRERNPLVGNGRPWVFDTAIGNDDVIRSLTGPRRELSTLPARSKRFERWRRHLREGFAATYRARYEKGDLRDAGTATFNGKPVRLYVVQRPARRLRPRLTALPYTVKRESREEFFLDADTGRPLGAVMRQTVRRPDGSVLSEWRSSTRVTLVEQVDPTPDNLAKLRPDWSDRPKLKPRRVHPGSREARRQRERAAARSSRAARDGG